MAAGAVWGAIAGVLKARSGAHEVITTIMLNYLALRDQHLRGEQRRRLAAGQPEPAGDQPGASRRTQLPIILDGTRLHAGFVIAVIAAIVLWYLLFRTTFGYKVRTVGMSPGAAVLRRHPLEKDDRHRDVRQRLAGRVDRRE